MTPDSARPDTVAVRLVGEFDHADPSFVRCIDDLIASGTTVVTLHGEGIAFCDSSFLATLIDARSRLHARGGSLVVADASTALRRLLEVTGVRHLFDDQSVLPGHQA